MASALRTTLPRLAPLALRAFDLPPCRTNVASRLCDEAKPGQILDQPSVLTKIENAVKVEPVGEFELKGIRRPLAAYNVLGAVSADLDQQLAVTQLDLLARFATARLYRLL